MNERLREIQHEVANLKKRAEELKLLKSDISSIKKLRENLVKIRFD
jgi:hypothetical protein